LTPRTLTAPQLNTPNHTQETPASANRVALTSGEAQLYPMIKVLLERAEEGWSILALEKGEAIEEQTHSALDAAAAAALDMADRHKSGAPELGDGVPPHALQAGEALRVARSAALHGGVS
jgi:hypothetical protein